MQKRYALIRTLSILALLFVGATLHSAQLPDNETLNYKVLFKWGLIQKQAGRATMKLNNTPNTFEATLYARSEPWADHIYSLRDTLLSTFSRHDLAPIKYQRIAHEDGKYAHDIVEFIRTGNTVVGDCTRFRRNKKNQPTNIAHTTLKAEGMTVDMLSVFYFLRTLDFKSMKEGDSHSVNIFSGKRKETLTIKFIGNESLKLDNVTYPTHRITFTFTTEGSKKSSDGIETWIWANESKIPLKLEGRLKVGKIKCLYMADKK